MSRGFVGRRAGWTSQETKTEPVLPPSLLLTACIWRRQRQQQEMICECHLQKKSPAMRRMEERERERDRSANWREGGKKEGIVIKGHVYSPLLSLARSRSPARQKSN